MPIFKAASPNKEAVYKMCQGASMEAEGIIVCIDRYKRGTKVWYFILDSISWLVLERLACSFIFSHNSKLFAMKGIIAKLWIKHGLDIGQSLNKQLEAGRRRLHGIWRQKLVNDTDSHSGSSARVRLEVRIWLMTANFSLAKARHWRLRRSK